MIAGKLNKRIKLQKFGTQTDDYGDVDTTTVEEKEVWASVNHKPSQEAVSGTKEELVKPCIFKMRTRPIDETWQIVYQNESYNIKSIFPIGDQGLEILATAGGRDGS